MGKNQVWRGMSLLKWGVCINNIEQGDECDSNVGKMAKGMGYLLRKSRIFCVKTKKTVCVPWMESFEEE